MKQFLKLVFLIAIIAIFFSGCFSSKSYDEAPLAWEFYPANLEKPGAAIENVIFFAVNRQYAKGSVTNSSGKILYESSLTPATYEQLSMALASSDDKKQNLPAAAYTMTFNYEGAEYTDEKQMDWVEIPSFKSGVTFMPPQEPANTVSFTFSGLNYKGSLKVYYRILLFYRQASGYRLYAHSRRQSEASYISMNMPSSFNMSQGNTELIPVLQAELIDENGKVVAGVLREEEYFINN